MTFSEEVEKIEEEIEHIVHDDKLALSFLFRISMWWRILYGAIRIVVGLALLKVIGQPFSEVFYRYMAHEIGEDSRYSIARFVYHTLQNHSYTVSYFVAAYVLFWGIVDVFLSVSLLRHKLWAFPVSIALIVFFVLYEIFRIFHTHSILLLWFILVDIVIGVIIYREYRELLSERNARRAKKAGM